MFEPMDSLVGGFDIYTVHTHMNTYIYACIHSYRHSHNYILRSCITVCMHACVPSCVRNLGTCVRTITYTLSIHTENVRINTLYIHMGVQILYNHIIVHPYTRTYIHTYVKYTNIET